MTGWAGFTERLNAEFTENAEISLHQYRVTKFDPAKRDSSGAYLPEEWTSVFDVGKSFSGRALSAREYLKYENAYVDAALRFLEEAKASVAIQGLENRGEYSESNLTIDNGTHCSLLEVATLVRLNLREKIWCRLEGRKCFIHFGYDYYMYVGAEKLCSKSIDAAKASGLFVEEFKSPYRE